MAALDDRPRSGKEPTITAEAKAWLVSMACRKAKELGYPHELWTTRLLARHVRERANCGSYPLRVEPTARERPGPSFAAARAKGQRRQESMRPDGRSIV
jgi:hypothetical protein